jgi:hypothetical protein
MSLPSNYVPPSQLHRKLSMLIAENDDYKRHVKLAVDELLMAKDKLTCSAINLSNINGVLRHIEFALDVLKKEKGDDYGSARQVKIQAETEGITLPAPKSSPTRSD